mmetsp:Transcript_87442/g.183003  ORF Transcript_87442/g.183003 Transcript_87442/m.183003 type:complete len:395 (+) Transcript_87442:150-1334(+)
MEHSSSPSSSSAGPSSLAASLAWENSSSSSSFSSPAAAAGPSSVALDQRRRQGNERTLNSEPLIQRGKRPVVTEAVRRNGRELRYASVALRADKEIVMMAVQQCPAAVQYASHDLRDDHDVALAVVGPKEHWGEDDEQGGGEGDGGGRGSAFALLGPRQRNDRDIAERALSKDSSMVQYLGKDLQLDKGLAEIAVQGNPKIIRCLHPDLQEDEDLVRLSLASDGSTLAMLALPIRKNRSFVLLAVRSNPTAQYYAVPDNMCDTREFRTAFKSALACKGEEAKEVQVVFQFGGEDGKQLEFIASHEERVGDEKEVVTTNGCLEEEAPTIGYVATELKKVVFSQDDPQYDYKKLLLVIKSDDGIEKIVDPFQSQQPVLDFVSSKAPGLPAGELMSS